MTCWDEPHPNICNHDSWLLKLFQAKVLEILSTKLTYTLGNKNLTTFPSPPFLTLSLGDILHINSVPKQHSFLAPHSGTIIASRLTQLNRMLLFTERIITDRPTPKNKHFAHWEPSQPWVLHVHTFAIFLRFALGKMFQHPGGLLFMCICKSGRKTVAYDMASRGFPEKLGGHFSSGEKFSVGTSSVEAHVQKSFSVFFSKFNG